MLSRLEVTESLSEKIFLGSNVGDLETGDVPANITRVNLSVDSDHYYTAGDDTGRTIEVTCPWGSQEMANSILASVSGKTYQPYTATDALLDPAAEIGDAVTLGGYYSVIAGISTSFDRASAPTISAPGSDEIDDEYPYESRERRETNRQLAKTRSLISKTSEEILLQVENELKGLSSSFSVQLDKISAELTDEINGLSASVDLKFDGLETSFEDKLNGLSADFDVKLNGLQANFEDEINGLSSTLNVKIDGIEASLEDEINGLSSSINLQIDSITSTVQGQGGQISQIQQTVTGISSQVSGLDGQMSSITQKVDNITLSVSNGSTSSSISLSVGGVVVSSQNIQMNGLVTFTGLANGTTTIDGACIKTGIIDADRIDADNLYVDAANITGSLVIGQLPDNVATTGDIPDKVSELENDEGYQTERGVVTIIDGTVDADYVNALGIRARYLQGETVQLLSSSGSLVGAMDIVNTNTGDGLTIGTNKGGIRIETGQSGNIYISSGYGPFLMLGYGDTGSTAMCQLGGGPLVLPGASYGSRAPSGSGEYGEVYFQLE